MKTLNKALTGLVILIIAVGCKKNDLELQQGETASNTVTTSQIASTTESGWNSAVSWNSSKYADSTLYSSNIQTNAVTADAVQNGLVRIFKTDNPGTASKALPFEVKSGTITQSWYYQVSEGNIMILVDVTGGSTNPAEKSLFNYIILSGDAVNEIEKQGTSKEDLMSVSYDQLKELIK